MSTNNLLYTPATTANEFPYTVVQRGYDWLAHDRVETIHFEVFDTRLELKTLIGVRWQEVFEFIMKTPDQGIRPYFALTKNGKILYTRRNAALFEAEADWLAAPKIVRGAFAINLMSSGDTLVEVLGGERWAHNRNTELLKSACYQKTQMELTGLLNQPII